MLSEWKKFLESEDKKGKIHAMMDEFIFFFIFENQIYASSENGRVIFAKMKDSSDEENTAAWRKEATFMACNLQDLIKNQENQRSFGEKEISKIDVISKEEAEKRLVKNV